MENKKAIFLRVMVISSLILLSGMAIFFKLVSIQTQLSDTVNLNDPIIQLKDIPSSRGNIYDVNGNLLATSMPVYTIAIDVTQVSDTLFENNYQQLAQGLESIFDQPSAADFQIKLRNARQSGKQYLKLKSDVRFSELQQVKLLPILSKGRYEGGFVYKQQTKRTKPFGNLCQRTIGYGRAVGDVGIEKAYNHYLKGAKGLQLMQKINGGIWKPLNNMNDVEPVSGSDVYSTIDIKIQDIAQTALLRSLEKFEAENGSIILMDVKTGAIRAMSSLERTGQGTYAEKYNHAFGAAYEPGSTFKLASLLVALEDGVVDTASIVDTKNGAFDFYDRTMYDSSYKKGGYGKISIGKAFEVSSNIGIARTIVDNYKSNPQRFIDRLSRIGISQKLDFELLGEATPVIKNTNDISWSGVSLPWIAFGYEIQMTALQILAFYNAVANNGEFVKPRLVDRVQQGGEVIENKKVEILKPSICSNETIEILQALLTGVVERGTASNIYSKQFSCAGKTGTAKIASEGGYGAEYRASFAGYFPADNPKYSCIVVISKPNKDIGFYGNIVAAPVFQELRDLLYAEEPIPVPLSTDANEKYYVAKVSELNVIHKELDYQTYDVGLNSAWLSVNNGRFNELTLSDNEMPNLKGMPAMDALYILENMGLNIDISGRGKVVYQSVKEGKQLNDNHKIVLRLS